jgi:hypothetical protein
MMTATEHGVIVGQKGSPQSTEWLWECVHTVASTSEEPTTEEQPKEQPQRPEFQGWGTMAPRR